MMTGRIIQLIDDQQFGAIAGEDGVDYVFHSRSLIDVRFDLLGDEERPGASDPYEPGDRGRAGQPAARSPLGVHEPENQQAVHDQRRRACLRPAAERAGITSGDVTLHTLRHTALSRMIAQGYDDYTVMAISGHSSTRMLARYTHPTEERKIGALAMPWVSTPRAHAAIDEAAIPDEIAELLGRSGGPREARTRDLRVANAALSQLS